MHVSQGGRLSDVKIPFRVTDAVISRGLTPPASLGWDHPWPAGTSVHRSGLPSKETTVFGGGGHQTDFGLEKELHTHAPLLYPSSCN